MEFNWIKVGETCSLIYFEEFIESHHGVNYKDYYKRSALMVYCKYAEPIEIDTIKMFVEAGNELGYKDKL